MESEALFTMDKRLPQCRFQQVVVDNKFSSTSLVLSGIPQGSALGPLLFLLFINNLPSNIDSVVKLYAEDVLIHRSIHHSNYHQTLQDDLNELAQWSTI